MQTGNRVVTLSHACLTVFDPDKHHRPPRTDAAAWQQIVKKCPAFSTLFGSTAKDSAPPIQLKSSGCRNAIAETVHSIPFWLSAPLLCHENTARLLLQPLQPIRVADRPTDCFGPPQRRIGGIFIERFTQELGEISQTLQHGRHLYKTIVIACQMGAGA